jgi:hypothetical protein
LRAGRDYYFRFLGPFAVVNGEGKWFSSGMKHWKVPLVGTNQQKTFACPRDVGRQCFVCETVKEIMPINPKLAQDYKAGLSYYFNVVDVMSPSYGVQTLDDGQTLFNILQELLEMDAAQNGGIPTLFDPNRGQVIKVNKLQALPWRTAVMVGVKSLDELAEGASSWGQMANLPNLDEKWEYIEYQEQRQMFSAIGGHAGPALPTAAPPPALAPAPAGPAQAAVPFGQSDYPAAPPQEFVAPGAAPTTAPAPAAPVTAPPPAATPALTPEVVAPPATAPPAAFTPPGAAPVPGPQGESSEELQRRMEQAVQEEGAS